jgi:hypothetical protein
MNTPMVAGQMGTYNAGAPMTGQMPDMGARKPRKKRGKKREVAAVSAFKRQMKVK